MSLKVDITRSANNNPDIYLIVTWNFTLHKDYCIPVCVYMYLYVWIHICVWIHIYPSFNPHKDNKNWEIVLLIPFHTDKKGGAQSDKVICPMPMRQ